jgi:hypothetical protein
MNQTTMMMKIAQYLTSHECWFTPHYTDGLIGMLERNGLLEWTIVGKQHQKNAYDALSRNGLRVDVAGLRNDYDLVVTCSDLFLPRNIRNRPIVLVQEGMTDPENWPTLTRTPATTGIDTPADPPLNVDGVLPAS